MKLLTEPNGSVSAETESTVRGMTGQRLSGYPLQYLLGEWEFFGLTFPVGEGVLIPRQDTEILAELARDFLLERSPTERNTLDLCAGTGCIGVTLAKLCGAEVKCVELSESAFGYLKRGIELNGVERLVTAVRGDVTDSEFTEKLGGKYDLIVSNPPYLTETDMRNLQTEVTHEPRMALYGGRDGLDFYRKMLAIWTKRLKVGGMFAVEIGINQERGVMEIFEENGLNADCIKDTQGIYRIVYAIK